MSQFAYDTQKALNHPHHPAMDELVSLLCHKTGNIDRNFFQAEVAYFLSLIPSAMRATIVSAERGEIPINIYSIALATSGFGKGHSVNLMEEVIGAFRDEFTRTSFQSYAEAAIYKLAVKIAGAKGSDEDTERQAIEAEFKRCGTAPFIFDSGTAPAVKQLIQKLLIAKAGSINFQMDEIGSNLQANAEVLNVLMELYDMGKVKTKLIKNSADNERGMDILGSTPANVLMFGTTSKLFDGAKIEDEFFTFLETGYARRCLFGVSRSENLTANQDPEQVYRSLIAKNKTAAASTWRGRLRKFADPTYMHQKITVPEEVGIEIVKYRLHCESIAMKLPEHEVILKAEISHRYFKAMKLAGVYAFLDESADVTPMNFLQAIRLVEESGESFKTILKRERNFARLAKYIAEVTGEVTHADLVEDLPFYPSSTGARKEIIDLAMAWGVRNRVVIKKNVVSGIEFFSGSALQETDLNKLKFTMSDNFATDFAVYEKPLDKLDKLLSAPGMHWCNHAFEGDHRKEDNVITGFNMLVVDVDGTAKLDAVHEMLSEYIFVTGTTKRHTDKQNRFRLIMPMNYQLYLDRLDYKEFMDSFLLWLPFESDTAANQRSKKWMTHENSKVHINKGTALIDVLPFIPKTKLNDDYVNGVKDLGNLDNLERWFLTEIDEGNRNNQMHKFAMMLKDGGLTFAEVRTKVKNLNSRTLHPLKESELAATVFKSVGSKYANEA